MRENLVSARGGTKWSVVTAQNPVTTNASGPNSYVQDQFTAVSAVSGGAFAEGRRGTTHLADSWLDHHS